MDDIEEGLLEGSASNSRPGPVLPPLSTPSESATSSVQSSTVARDGEAGGGSGGEALQPTLDANRLSLRVNGGSGGFKKQDLKLDLHERHPQLPPNVSTSSSFGAARRPQSLRPPMAKPNPRVCEVWPLVGGKNQFPCRGRCITGPTIDRWYNCCAWSFILIPTAVFFVGCGGYLWKHVNPLLPLLTGLVFLSTVTFLLLTSCTDPGIIPRHALQLVVDGLESEVARVTGTSPLALDAVTGEPVCELTPQQDEIGYRWCLSCKVVRPPRASHCRDCDNCVMRFDHHCPFVNNCVGARNYAYFSAFLLSTACLGFAVVVGTVLFFSHRQGSSVFTEGPVLWGLLVVLGLPTVTLVVAVFGLGCFHAYLSCRGRTTKEVLTGRTSADGRTLFTLRGASLVKSRTRVSYPMSVV